jgi:hypothetical protein
VRRNPRRLGDRAENLDEIAHIVCQVFDANVTIRHFGEGRMNRPEHVNRGCSHPRNHSLMTLGAVHRGGNDSIRLRTVA